MKSLCSTATHVSDQLVGALLPEDLAPRTELHQVVTVDLAGDGDR